VTAWQAAAERCHLEVLEKQGFWAKEVHLNPNELNNKLLVTKEQYGYTAFHWAAESRCLEVFEKTQSWVKERSTEDGSKLVVLWRVMLYLVVLSLTMLSLVSNESFDKPYLWSLNPMHLSATLE